MRSLRSKTSFVLRSRLIADDPESGFASDQIDSQAEALAPCAELAACMRLANGLDLRFGRLLRRLGSCLRMAPNGWRSWRRGIHFVSRSGRAKIRDLARFVNAVLGSRKAWNADLTVVFEERRSLAGRWVFPEAAVIGETTMIAVEDVTGYSLLVPADCVARSQEALETSAPSAAVNFMEGVAQYLEVHPHEATNLAAAIYNSESLTLPREIAR